MNLSLSRWFAPFIVPAVFDFWVQKLSPVWSSTRCLARVTSRVQESEDTVSLTLSPNRHFKGYEPGQHVSIYVEVNGIRLKRCYSPSSPWDGKSLTITVRREPHGKVSAQLVDNIVRGDVVEIAVEPAFGEMTSKAVDGDTPVILVAGGSGITPLFCLLQSLLDEGHQAPVVLKYWVSRRAQLCFLPKLQALTARYPNFTFQPVFTRETFVNADEGQGRPAEAHFQDLQFTTDSATAFVCGSDGFVDAVSPLLNNLGAKVLSESFTPLANRMPAAKATAAQEMVEVTLAKSGKVLQVASDTNLLSALEAAGETPEYGCRRGICNTCSCAKAQGSTEDMIAGHISHEAAQIRLCISSAKTDLVLNL